jgi:hypothetical protein
MNKLFCLFLIFAFFISIALCNPLNSLNKNQTQIECPVCIAAINLVNVILKQNKTDNQIIQDLKKVCNLFHVKITIQNVIILIFSYFSFLCSIYFF